MKDLFLAIRPLNCFMAGIAVMISIFLGNGTSMGNFLCAFLSVFLICAGGMLINDYFDWELDRINKPEKWKKLKKHGKNRVKQVSFLLFAAGNAFSALISLPVFILALANTAVLIFYSWRGKRITFGKNLLISYLVSSVFIYGALISENILPSLIFSVLAFFSTLGREIVKDITDVKGDRARGVKTLPVILGEKVSAYIASFFVIMSVLLSPLPYFAGVFSKNYLLFITPGVFLFMVSCFLSLISPEKSSRMLKMAMLLALLAFILSKFF